MLTKGVPLRIAGTAGLDGIVASVDSELTLLYRKITGVLRRVRGHVDNPYYLGDRDVREAQRFTHREHDIFLVSRLDAFTVDEALAMIDRAQSPVTEGSIVLDQRATLGNATGDEWLDLAATRMRELGFGERVLLEDSKESCARCEPGHRLLWLRLQRPGEPRPQFRNGIRAGLARGDLCQHRRAHVPAATRLVGAIGDWNTKLALRRHAANARRRPDP